MTAFVPIFVHKEGEKRQTNGMNEIPFEIILSKHKKSVTGAADVAQLAEQILTMPEIRGSNPRLNISVNQYWSKVCGEI